MMLIQDFIRGNKNKIIVILILGLLGFLYLTLSMPGDDLRLRFNGISELNESWGVKELTGEEYTVDLPYFGEAQKGETLRISKVLPAEFSLPQTIRIRSSMQHIQITLDDKVIFDNTLHEQDNIPYSPEVSAWYLIDIPGSHENSILDMYISSEISIMTGRVNGVYYGPRGDLIIDLIKGHAINIMVILFIFSVTLYSLIICFLVDIRKMRRIGYLCAFSMTIGAWMVAEMDLIQLFVSKHYFVGTTSYLMLPMATMMFISYMYEAVLTKYRKLLINYVFIIGLYLITSVVLQLFFDIDYIILIPIFVVLLTTVVSTITVLLYIEIRHKNKDAKKYLAFISIIIFAQVLETLMYLVGDFNNVSSFSSVGIMTFLLMVVVDTIRHMNHVIKKEAETRYLRLIAYVDPLTQGHNRAAFERDIDKELKDSKKREFRLTLFDLNKLKSINDQFGHEVGDEALIGFYRSLVIAFDKDATCYRIGGDEFMVIHSSTSEELFYKSLEQLKLLLYNVEKSVAYTLDAAYGSDIYSFNETFGTFKHRVDMRMYENKQLMVTKLA